MNRGFNSAISGLNAASAGLYVTGHNMANTNTVGYVRQQVITQDFLYDKTGLTEQVGLGVDVSMIRQIRNQYLDVNYRNEVGRLGFYTAKYNAGNEIEVVLGELQSRYSTQTITQDMWSSLNELSMHPSGMETRGNFVTTAISYITKMNNIYERLVKEQHNINEDIKTTITRMNQLTTRIDELNKEISAMEVSGQRANDMRDERNLCIDELASLIKIEYKENSKGVVDITTNGAELVVNGCVQRIGLRFTGPKSAFVEPVFTDSTEILDYDPSYKNAKTVFSYPSVINSENLNDSGLLFGLMVARGLYPATYNSLNTLNNAFSALDHTVFNLASMPLPTVTGQTVTQPQPPPDPDDFRYGVNDPEYVKYFRTYLDEVKTYLGQVQTTAAFATAPQDEIDAFFNYVVYFNQQDSTFNTYRALLDLNSTYVPFLPQNNIGSQVFYVDPASYGGDPAEVPVYTGVDLGLIPVPADYPKGVFDQDYIKDTQKFISENLDSYIKEMEAFFKGKETTLADYNQQYADFKAFRDNVQTLYSDTVRLADELAAYPTVARLVEFNATNCTIPSALRQLDCLFNYTVNLVNNTLATGYDLNGVQSQTKIFVTKDGSSMFTLGNVVINPELLNPDGYNLLCLSKTGDRDDSSAVSNLLEAWNSANFSIDDSYGMGIEEAYRYVVNNIAVETNTALSFCNAQTGLVDEIDQKRKQISGVSIDEEMTNMMVYQHAYNAASRVVNVIDSMIDRIINGTGRVGR